MSTEWEEGEVVATLNRVARPRASSQGTLQSVRGGDKHVYKKLYCKGEGEKC